MRQIVDLKCKGLYTYPNDLSAIPEGALTQANNIYIDRQDVAEPRRGFKVFTVNALTTVAKSLHNYMRRILVNQSTLMQYETDPTGSPGVFTTYQETVDGVLVNASVISPDASNDLRIKSVEANKNLYFTSSKGIRKLDGVTQTILNAGVPQALDFDLSLLDEDGFLEQNNTIAYRVVWGFKDANENLILGAPSQAEIIYYFGNSQFIDDVNTLITNLTAQSPPLTKTYTPDIASTSTLTEIYTKMKDIVENLNQEGLTSTDYEAGGTIEKTLITFKTYTLSTSSSYLLFEDSTATTYYLWVNKTGVDPAPNPNIEPDLRLDYVGIEMNISSLSGNPNDSAAVAAIAQTAISGSPAQVNLSLTGASLTVSNYVDAVVTPTTDGSVPTTYFIDQIQAGTILEGSSLTLENLQTGYDNVVELLNAEVTLTPSFVEARTTKTVELNHITIPAEIISLSATGTSFFYQIYRSRQFPLSDAVTVVPDDELQLVYEDTPTQSELDQGYVGPLDDIVTEDFRATGALLYTNQSQEGILQANTRPPYALDIALYQNTIFYSNTKQTYNLSLSLLTGKESTGSTDPGFNGGVVATLINQGLTYTSKFGGTTGNSTTIRLLNPFANSQPLSVTVSSTAITVHLATNGGGAIISTPDQIKAAINANISASSLVYVSGSGSSAVIALVTTNLVGGTACDTIVFTEGSETFSITFVSTAFGDNFPLGFVALIDETDRTPSQLIDDMSKKIIKAINRQIDNSFLEAYYLSSFNTTPGQLFIKNRYIQDPIFIVNSPQAHVQIAFNPNLGSSDAVATNSSNINFLFYSKEQQPEAVPLVNYFPVGAGDQAIVRILPLRDSLIIFKTDGIFRLSGTSGNFQVIGFDNTAFIIAPDTAVIGNNQVYLLTNQGIVLVTESDVKIISRQIEDEINKLLSLNLYPNVQSVSFGVFYTTERKYYCWLPTETDDTTATQCFVYNIFTDCWTRLPIDKTCGLVNIRDNRLYLGPGDLLHIEQERKNYDIYDYSDREYTTQVISQSYDAIEDEYSLVLQSTANAQVGDAIEQTQYVTPFYFNRVLTKLDNSGAQDVNYYTNLGVTLKSQILSHLNSLADKLDADPGVTDTTYRANIDAVVGSTPPIIQQKFNVLVAQLNTDVGVHVSTFLTITSNPTFYTHILDVDTSTNTVIVQDVDEYYIADIKIYRHISTEITWAPNHAGNPALTKQFSEANILFSTLTSRDLDLSFSCDISANFEATEFQDDSLIGWGRSAWGTTPWGSDPEPRAFRTYVPRLKQRCRYINTKFTHARALESYLLVGVSLSYSAIQQRVTR